MPSVVPLARRLANTETFRDYKKIITLAYPVVLSNAVDTLMMMIDRLFLAKVPAVGGSEVLLGGAMGGGAIAWLLQAPLLGFFSYTNAMCAQNFGRQDLPRCTQVVPQAMYWVLIYYPLILFCSQFTPLFLTWIGHDPKLVQAEWSYAQILVVGSIFALLRLPLSSFYIASNRSSLVMRASFAGMLLNIPLDYLFIFDVALNLGGWSIRPSDLGIPGGIGGAAFATMFAQLLVFAILLLRFLRQPQEYRLASSWRWRTSVHLELMRFGLPVGLESLLVSLSFNIFLILFNSISPLVAAAGTITLSWDLCNIVILMGVSTATTTLVGQSLGAGDIAQAKRFVRRILVAALVFSGFFSLWFLLAPGLLISVFVTEATASQEQLIALSRAMLRLSAIYLLADALGVVMRGSLNGAGDTFASMLIAVALHLFVLLPGSVIILKVWQYGALESWVFLVLFILCANGALALRYLSGRWARRWDTSEIRDILQK